MTRPRARRIHRGLGLALLAPCVVWAVTGFLFHWKPGWRAAYAPLSAKTYPRTDAESVPGSEWLETRRLRTILGDHLLVETEDGWAQRDPLTGGPRPEPAMQDRIRLFEDAVAGDPERYGEIASLQGWSATTSTGIEVTLDWETLRFRQRGRDTAAIDLLYRIHYLQWTGHAGADRVVPVLALAGLLVLSILGLRIATRK